MIYTLTLNPALDYVVFVDEFTPGVLNRASGESVQFGGKGVNVSLLLKELGVSSTALGMIAGFTGEALAGYLTEKGIKEDFIRLKAGLTRINIKLKSGEETEINGSGPIIDEAAQEVLFHKLGALQKGDTLVLAGSVPPSLPSGFYGQILSLLAEKEVCAVVDTSGDALRKVIVHRPFLLKPNHHELGELFGKRLSSIDEIIVYGDRLRGLGVKNVLVSMAENGALLFAADGGVYRVSAPRGKAVNSVGAGDSMLAGFLAGLDGGYAHALRLGAAAGSATAFSDGLADRAHIMALYEKIAVTWQKRN